MNGKNFLFPIIITGLFAISCEGNSTLNTYGDFSNVTTDTLRIENNLILDSCNIDSLIENIEIIPLKEEKGAYIGDIYKVFYKDGKFIVHDRNNTRQILLFNEDGSFQKRILGVGQGPDEALQIDDCWIDENGNLEAYDFAVKKVFHFDSINYNLKSYTKGGQGIYHNLLKTPGKNGFYAYATFNSHNEKINGKAYNLSILDGKLKPIKGLIPFDPVFEDVLLLASENTLFTIDDTLKFSTPYSNLIYSFVNDSLVKVTSLEYSEKSLTHEKLTELIKKNLPLFKDRTINPNERLKKFEDLSYYYGHYNETSKYTLFSSVADNKIFHSILMKDQNTMLNSNLFYETKYNLIIPHLTLSNGYLIGYINSLYLDKYLIGNSPLDKYKGIDFNGFLLVKLKLK